MKITPRKKGVSTPSLAFLAWGDFYARSRSARSTIPEEKWRLIVVYEQRDCFSKSQRGILVTEFSFSAVTSFHSLPNKTCYKNHSRSRNHLYGHADPFAFPFPTQSKPTATPLERLLRGRSIKTLFSVSLEAILTPKRN